LGSFGLFLAGLWVCLALPVGLLAVDVLLGIGLVLIGLVGALLPILPGVPILYAGLLITAWADNFHRVGLPTLLILALIATVAWSIDLIAAALGAKRYGASRQAVIGTMVGTLAGLFFGLPGILLGPLLGAFLGELLAGTNARHASRIGLATWLGLTLGLLFKLTLCFMMIGLFTLVWLS